jgi:hypothetical protein
MESKATATTAGDISNDDTSAREFLYAIADELHKQP